MKEYHVNIFYSEEDEGYIAEIPDLKYCSAFGETPVEALEQIEIAKKTWLEVAKSEGKRIPEPKYKPDLRKDENELLKYLNKIGIRDKKINSQIPNIYGIASSKRIKKKARAASTLKKARAASKPKKVSSKKSRSSVSKKK